MSIEDLIAGTKEIEEDNETSTKLYLSLSEIEMWYDENREECKRL